MKAAKTFLVLLFFWPGLSILSDAQQDLIKDFAGKFARVGYETLYEVTGSHSASIRFYNEELNGTAHYQFLCHLDSDRDTIMLFFKDDPCVTELCDKDMSVYKRVQSEWMPSEANWFNRDSLHRIVVNEKHKVATGRTVTYYVGWQVTPENDSLIRVGFIDRYWTDMERDSEQLKDFWLEDYYEVFFELIAGEWALKED